MTKNDEWNEFLNNLCLNALSKNEKSKEYEYLKERQAQIDEMLTTNLTADEKVFIEEILSELGDWLPNEKRK